MPRQGISGGINPSWAGPATMALATAGGGARAERAADNHVTVPDERIHVHQPIVGGPATPGHPGYRPRSWPASWTPGIAPSWLRWPMSPVSRRRPEGERARVVAGFGSTTARARPQWR